MCVFFLHMRLVEFGKEERKKGMIQTSVEYGAKRKKCLGSTKRFIPCIYKLNYLLSFCGSQHPADPFWLPRGHYLGWENLIYQHFWLASAAAAAAAAAAENLNTASLDWWEFGHCLAFPPEHITHGLSTWPGPQPAPAAFIARAPGEIQPPVPCTQPAWNSSEKIHIRYAVNLLSIKIWEFIFGKIETAGRDLWGDGAEREVSLLSEQ